MVAKVIESSIGRSPHSASNRSGSNFFAADWAAGIQRFAVPTAPIRGRLLCEIVHAKSGLYAQPWTRCRRCDGCAGSGFRRPVARGREYAQWLGCALWRRRRQGSCREGGFSTCRRCRQPIAGSTARGCDYWSQLHVSWKAYYTNGAITNAVVTFGAGITCTPTASGQSMAALSTQATLWFNGSNINSTPAKGCGTCNAIATGDKTLSCVAAACVGSYWGSGDQLMICRQATYGASGTRTAKRHSRRRLTSSNAFQSRP